MRNVVVTGGAGFIGSNFLKSIAVKESGVRFIVVDALTYAGLYETIQSDVKDNAHIDFVLADIRDGAKMASLFEANDIDGVLHFAAESHVDRSIHSPSLFVETNVNGTLNLLKAALARHEKGNAIRYLQVSTDEVYGQLSISDPAFCELTPLAPNSPYSASKASADLLVRGFNHTYGLDTIITRCSNNYGPFQFPEKLIPLMVNQARLGKKLPVYGKGENIRDWIHVEDHVMGIWAAFQRGKSGEVYNFGGDAERTNLEVVRAILKHFDLSEDIIEYVEDRPGHDFRYAINFNKAKTELDWTPKHNFEDSLAETINWYKKNLEWCQAANGRAESNG